MIITYTIDVPKKCIFVDIEENQNSICPNGNSAQRGRVPKGRKPGSQRSKAGFPKAGAGMAKHKAGRQRNGRNGSFYFQHLIA